MYQSALSGKRVLLILDDVEDGAQIRPLLPSPDCAVIITSRKNLTIGVPILLPDLPIEEAVRFLRSQCLRNLKDEEAKELATLCGRLPLALRIAGGFLKISKSKPTDEYINDLKTYRLETLKGEDGDVEAVFETSWRALDDFEKRAWTTLSIIPANFDRETALATMPDYKEVAIKGRRKQLAISSYQQNQILDSLESYNLLEYDIKSQRFHWHDLLVKFTLQRITQQDLFEGQIRYAKHFTDVASKSQNLYLMGGQGIIEGLQIYDQQNIHIEASLSVLYGLNQREQFCRLMNEIV